MSEDEHKDSPASDQLLVMPWIIEHRGAILGPFDSIRDAIRFSASRVIDGPAACQFRVLLKPLNWPEASQP